MNAFILSVDGEKIFGSAAAGFKAQITQLRDALVVGGDENAEKLGKQLGEAVALYAQVVATGGSGGAAQGASTLSKAGVDVSINGFKEIAATTKAAGGVEGKLVKFERVGPNPDVPRPIDVPNHVPVGGPQYVKSATIQANTTVELSESVTLQSGKVIPKGSIVTVSDDTLKVVYADGRSERTSYSKVNTPPLLLTDGTKGAGEVASIGGKTCVYNCVVDGVTRYVGITDDIVKRGQAHLREKGITIDRIEGLQNLSRADARAVEQALIDYHGLGKDGGTLINKINSISSVKNPTKYEQGLIRGAELLKKAGYEGF